MFRKFTYATWFFILTSCGYFKDREPPKVTPGAQPIKVGSQSLYVLDPSQSDPMLNKSEITVSITGQNKQTTNFKVDGYAQTDFGNNTFGMQKQVPNDVLTMAFVEKLRSTRHYDSPLFKADYLGKLPNGCEEIRIYDIQGYEWIKPNPQLCLKTKNVPKIKVQFTLAGKTFQAVYLLDSKK